jgi:hypothetical protein
MRSTKITFGEMRDMGVRGILVYCADYHCSHSAMTSGIGSDAIHRRVIGRGDDGTSVTYKMPRLSGF